MRIGNLHIDTEESRNEQLADAFLAGFDKGETVGAPGLLSRAERAEEQNAALRRNNEILSREVAQLRTPTRIIAISQARVAELEQANLELLGERDCLAAYVTDAEAGELSDETRSKARRTLAVIAHDDAMAHPKESA